MTDESRQEPEAIYVELGGEKRELKPTLNAATRLARLPGGLVGVMNSLRNYELDIYVAVLAHGVGFTQQGQKGLEQKVFDAGMSNLIGPCSRYIMLLINGGRDPRAEEQKEDPREESASA